MKSLKIPVKNQELLAQALTHRSFLNENQEASAHNERLEFLGDAVLELAVSKYLYENYPDKPEGELTAYRAALVKTGTLAKTAKTLDLGGQLRLSKGEELSGGRQNLSLLANTFEAVVGAIYLDQGFEAAYGFLGEHLFPQIGEIIKLKLFKDYKSSLQELVQAKGADSPIYVVKGESGPDHEKSFNVAVVVDGTEMGSGTGRSKQQAQQHAAKAALEKYRAS